MLTTNARFTAFLNDAAQDPTTGVTRARTCDAATVVTAPAYLALATIASTPSHVWSEFGRKPMTNVRFHDRWPLYSTS